MDDMQVDDYFYRLTSSTPIERREEIEPKLNQQTSATNVPPKDDMIDVQSEIIKNPPTLMPKKDSIKVISSFTIQPPLIIPQNNSDDQLKKEPGYFENAGNNEERESGSSSTASLQKIPLSYAVIKTELTYTDEGDFVETAYLQQDDVEVDDKRFSNAMLQDLNPSDEGDCVETEYLEQDDVEVDDKSYASAMLQDSNSTTKEVHGKSQVPKLSGSSSLPAPSIQGTTDTHTLQISTTPALPATTVSAKVATKRAITSENLADSLNLVLKKTKKNEDNELLLCIGKTVEGFIRYQTKENVDIKSDLGCVKKHQLRTNKGISKAFFPIHNREELMKIDRICAEGAGPEYDSIVRSILSINPSKIKSSANKKNRFSFLFDDQLFTTLNRTGKFVGGEENSIASIAPSFLDLFKEHWSDVLTEQDGLSIFSEQTRLAKKRLKARNRRAEEKSEKLLN